MVALPNFGAAMDQTNDSLTQSLEVLGLTLPVSQEQLIAKRRELLHTWHPARYANLTNNPKKYMQMFKQAEEMTKKVEAAYILVSALLVPDENLPPG